MATTFYCPSTGSASISPNDHSSWDIAGAAFSRNKAVTTPISSAMTSNNMGNTSTANAQVSGYQWVYGPIGAQTISGDVEARVRGKAGTFTNLFNVRIAVWIAKPDATLRATLYSADSAFSGVDWGTTFAGYVDTKTLTSGTAQDGDYLVLEVGANRNGFVDTDECYVEIGDVTSSTRMYFAFVDTITFWAPAGLTYSEMTARYKRGTAITTNSPSSTGGPIASYAVQTGSLPTGLSLNTTTGEITGTPTVSGVYQCTIRATNEGGTTDSSTITYTIFAGNSINVFKLATTEIKVGN